ncbi:MAG: hypothetical protein V1731_01825 [Candidatus Aenigmatarchaeota archaeon]
MPRKWTHKVPRKSHKLFFVANDIPTGVGLAQIMNEIFGQNSKSGEAMSALFQAFVEQKTLTLSDKQVNGISVRLQQENSVSKGVFYASLKDLISLGLLRRDESGFYSLITDFSSALKRLSESYKNFVTKLKEKPL